MGLILVDSSVWIDFFARRVTIQTAGLRSFVATNAEIGVGDLVLTEVLQGARDERHGAVLIGNLSEFYHIPIVDRRVAIAAAGNYRLLRARGITVRKTIDTLIATRCILDKLPLLYSDRDFDPFVEHLGLISATTALGVSQ